MKGVAPHDRPREKLERLGPAGLGDNELLAVVLGGGVRGRRALDLANRPIEPARAVEAFRRALGELPQDLTTRYQLARALRAAGRADEAKSASEAVARLAEVLSPAKPGPRLDPSRRLDDPAVLRDLADLCERAGLTRLAEAWRTPDNP